MKKIALPLSFAPHYTHYCPGNPHNKPSGNHKGNHNPHLTLLWLVFQGVGVRVKNFFPWVTSPVIKGGAKVLKLHGVSKNFLRDFH